MGAIRLMIVEDNAELRKLHIQFFSSRSEFNIAGVFDNGFTALENVIKLLPDAVLLDMTLPQMDGMSYLESVSKLDLPKEVVHIVLSASDSYVSEALRYAKAYYIKPFNYKLLADKIITLCADGAKSAEDWKNIPELCQNASVSPRRPTDREIMQILLKAGIPSHVRGFTYLHACIKACVDDVTKLDGVSKVLYPAVAKDFNTSGQSVERAIRHALDAAWDSIPLTEEVCIYTQQGISFGSKPTNCQFLASVVNTIMLGG